MYRNSPHSVTGFSPFQLIYGLNICGPLEGVRDNCIDGDMFNGTLLEWDDQLKLNQLDFSVLADDNTARAKCKMKVYFDCNVGPEPSFSPSYWYTCWVCHLNFQTPGKALLKLNVRLFLLYGKSLFLTVKRKFAFFMPICLSYGISQDLLTLILLLLLSMAFHF